MCETENFKFHLFIPFSNFVLEYDLTNIFAIIGFTGWTRTLCIGMMGQVFYLCAAIRTIFKMKNITKIQRKN